MGTAFKNDRRGMTAILFTLLAPLLLIAVDAAVEYGHIALLRARLQRAADAGALAGAQALSVANSRDASVAAAARSVALATLQQDTASPPADLTIDASVRDDRRTVSMRLVQAVDSLMGRTLTLPSKTVRAEASASLIGQTRICVLALDTASTSTLDVRATAQISAPLCSVSSNSTSAHGVLVGDTATIKTASLCSSGGAEVSGGAHVTPAALTDCPALKDPLAGIVVPTSGGCTYTGRSISTQTPVTLQPGVYCNGLTVGGSANVTLSPGTYIIDGRLTVTGSAAFSGANIGLVLRGTNAGLLFDSSTRIALTAPASGPMAGILMFEDRAVPLGRQYRIASNNAHQILGTIYVPHGEMTVDATNAVGDQSAWTVIVARQFKVRNSANMVLNAMYGASNVPVPEGISNTGTRVTLTR